MKYRVIMPGGELADGQWYRPEDVPEMVLNRRGRLIKTAELRILVEDDLGTEYEVCKWEL